MTASAQKNLYEETTQSLKEARHQLLLLVVASSINDQDGTAIAGLSLQAALKSVERSIDSAGVARAPDHVAQLKAIRQEASHWLPPGGRSSFIGDAARRFVARAAMTVAGTSGAIVANRVNLAFLILDELPLTGISMVRATLTSINARRAVMDRADLSSAYVVHCKFEHCSLLRASFDLAGIERCLFHNATFDGSTFVGVNAYGCRFNDGHLADLSLDRAVFKDCDFRGVTIGTKVAECVECGHEPRFVGCDFRGATWLHCDPGTTFIDCRFHGARIGALAGCDFIRPDFSPTGDGSEIAASREMTVRTRRGAPN